MPPRTKTHKRTTMLDRHMQRPYRLTHKLLGMGLSHAQVAAVHPLFHPMLVKHLRGGNRFTDFFTKTLKHGFIDFGNKVKDAFTKPVQVPAALDKVLSFFRDKVNPNIVKAAHWLADKNIPVLGLAGKVIAPIGDAYLKAVPPQGSGLSRRKRLSKCMCSECT